MSIFTLVTRRIFENGLYNYYLKSSSGLYLLMYREKPAQKPGMGRKLCFMWVPDRKNATPLGRKLSHSLRIGFAEVIKAGARVIRVKATQVVK